MQGPRPHRRPSRLKRLAPCLGLAIALGLQTAATAGDTRPGPEDIEQLEHQLDQDPANRELRLRLAKALHFEAVEGDGDAFKRSGDLLEALHAEDPDDPVVTTYLGSHRLIEAKRTWLVWRKGELVREGVVMMHRAVDAAPGDVEIRWVRAVSTHHLPDWMEQGPQSARDFAWAAKRAAEAVASGRLEPWIGAHALYHHGTLAWEAGDADEARRAWARAIELAPQSEPARLARAAINEHGPAGP